MCFVYILLSLKDNKTYVGYTKNLELRLRFHNDGKVISTKHRRPLRLFFCEKFKSIEEAKKKELWWKSGEGRRKLKEIFNKNKIMPE